MTTDVRRVGRVLAARILQAALDEDRADELLECLFDGGGCTVDPYGKLVLVSADALANLDRFMARAASAAEVNRER
jgi:hypothetical protein